MAILSTQAIAFAVAIEIEIHMRQHLVYGIVYYFRYVLPDPNFIVNWVDALLTAFMIVFITLPVICSLLITFVPQKSRSHFHWIAFGGIVLFIVWAFFGIPYWDGVLAGVTSALSCLGIWVIMRYLPTIGKAQQ